MVSQRVITVCALAGGLSLALVSPAFGQPTVADAMLVGPASGISSLGVQQTESSYIIYTDGTDCFAQDGETGSVFSSGPDAAAVIQDTINQTASEGGGRIFIKAGVYALGTRLDIAAQNNLLIEGTDATILTSTAGSALRINQQSDKITLYRLTFRDCADKAVNCESGSNIRIIDCVFENIQSSAIQGRLADDPNDPLSNVWVLGCRVSDADLNNQGSGARGGIYFYRTENLYLQNNLVERCGCIGISVQRSSSHVICANNIVRDNDVNAVTGQGHGIYIGPCDHVVVRGNVVTGNGGNGFEGASGSYNAADDRAPLFVVTGNILIGNGFNNTNPGGGGHYRNGIFITGRHHVVSNNLCRENWGTGITVGRADHAQKINVQGNIVGDNNVGADSRARYGAGIVCQDSTDSSVRDQLIQIKDNLVYDESEVGGAQVRAIQCEDNADGIIIEGNRVDGHPQPQISFDPTVSNIIVRHNTGFRTTANGVVEESFPLPGSSGSTIPIDLAASLDLDDVGVSLDRWRFRAQLVSPSGGGGYGGAYLNYWIDQPSPTVFEIHWDSGMARSQIRFEYTYGSP